MTRSGPRVTDKPANRIKPIRFMTWTRQYACVVELQHQAKKQASVKRASLDWFTFAIGRLKSTFQVDGGRSSMVELQIVILAVAGSSPVGHPCPVAIRHERLILIWKLA